MKDTRINAAEALAAIAKLRRQHQDAGTWPSWPPSPPQPGVCPNNECFSEHNNIITPTKLRVGPDGRASCGRCGYVNTSRTFPYNPPAPRTGISRTSAS